MASEDGCQNCLNDRNSVTINSNRTRDLSITSPTPYHYTTICDHNDIDFPFVSETRHPARQLAGLPLTDRQTDTRTHTHILGADRRYLSIGFSRRLGVRSPGGPGCLMQECLNVNVDVVVDKCAVMTYTYVCSWCRSTLETDMDQYLSYVKFNRPLSHARVYAAWVVLTIQPFIVL